MSQAKIKTLTDDSGAIIYPRTKAEAVYGLENMGTRLELTESRLESVESSVSSISESVESSVSSISSHTSNKSNPHGVTLSQLGVTISTSAPSGGSNGDIWIQYS